MNRNKKLVLSGLFIACGIILPLIFHQIGNSAGKIFLPIHIPVLAAGLILGSFEGILVAALSVGLSFLIVTMPTAVLLPFVATEAMIYGLLAGLFKKTCQKGSLWIYVSLISTQICGRILYAAVLFLCVPFPTAPKTATVLTALGTSFIGIIAQIVIVPLIVRTCLKNDTTSKENIKG